jgi:Tfp pilus assembly protein PilO
MKATNRIVILGLGVAVLAAAAWLLVLSPKRQDAATLGEKVERLEASIAQHEQTASYGEEARRAFPRTYQQLVVLGKAVPAGDDTSAMLVQLSSIASDADVEFGGIELDSDAGAEAPAPVPVPTEEQPPAEGDGSVPAAAPPPAPATEATAANLPIGSSIGPAGLPVTPYQLRFTGDFFRVADFLSGVDRLVSSNGRRVVVDGRLMTIDGFSLTGDPGTGFPRLDASFAMTAYATPSEQGLTLGASPSGPAVTPPGDTTPVSTSSQVTP